MAPTQSALAEKPRKTQTNFACVLRYSPEVCRHSGHLRLVFGGGTGTKRPPFHCVLYDPMGKNFALGLRLGYNFQPSQESVLVRTSGLAFILELSDFVLHYGVGLDRAGRDGPKKNLRAFQFCGLLATCDQQLGGQRYAAAWMPYSSEY